MILCHVFSENLARMRSGSQFKHIVDQPADDREGGEQHKSNEQHGFPTENITKLGIDDEKAYYPQVRPRLLSRRIMEEGAPV